MVATRRRRRWWILAALALLILGVWVALAAVQGWIQTRIPHAVEKNTGCSVLFDSLDVDYFPPAVTARGVQLDCPDAGTAAAARLHATLEPWPLLRRNVVIARLELDGLRLDFRDALHLPPRDPAGGGVQVRIESFRLKDGTVRYRDAENDVLVEARGIEAASNLLFAARRLEAAVSSPEVLLTVADLELPPEALEGDLRHEGSELALRNVTARLSGLGQMDAGGTFHFGRPAGATPAYRLDGEVRASSSALAKLLGLPEEILPEGELHWAGQVEGAGARWRLDGDARAEELAVQRLKVADLRLHSTAARGTVGLEDLRGRLLQGLLKGSVLLEESRDAWRLSTESRLEDASLDELAAWGSGQNVPLLGSLLTLDVDGGFPLGHVDQAGASLRATLQAVGDDGLQPAGSIQATLAGQRLEDIQAQLEMPGTELRVLGDAGLDGRLELQFGLEVSSLERLAGTLAPLFPATGWLVEQDAQGSVRWNGRMSGAWPTPQAGGRLASHGLTLAGIPLGILSGSLQVRDGRVHLTDVRLEGELASLRLQGSGALATDPDWQVEWDASRVDLHILAGALALPFDLEGAVAASGRGWLRADDAGVEASVQGEELLVAGGLPLDRLDTNVAVDGHGLHVHGLVARAQGGTLQASGSLTGAPGEGLQVDAESFPLQVIPQFEGLHGRMSLSTRLQGPLSEVYPAEPILFRLEDLSWQDQELLDLQGRLGADRERVTLSLQSTDSVLHADAELLWDEERSSHGTLTLQPMRITVASHPQAGDLVANLGATQLEFSVPLSDPAQLTADLVMEGVSLVNGSRVLEQPGPVKLQVRGDELELPLTKLRLGDLTFTLQGTGQMGPPLRYAVALRGVSDLGLLQPLLPDARVAGTATLDLQLHGEGDAPWVSGDLIVNQGYLKLFDFRHAIENLSATMNIDGGLIRLRSLDGQVAGGEIQASGELHTDGSRLLGYRVEWRGRRISLLYPEDFPSLSDFELLVEGNDQGALLSGDVRLLQGRFTRKLNLERSMLSRVRRLQMPPLPGPPDVLELDLTVTAPERLWLDNDLGRAEFRADLNVQGTAARPVLDGTLDLVQAGHLRFQRVEYTLSGATLVFSPVFPNDPEIDAEARAEELDPFDVRVHASGRLSDLRFDLSSDPELGEDEIAAMLLSGGFLRQGGDPFATSAYSSTTTSAPGSLTDVESAYDPAGVQTQAETSRQLTLGAQISSRLSSSWSTGLSGTGESTVELRYRLLPHLELREAKDLSGANLAELRYIRSFRIGPEPERKEGLIESRRGQTYRVESVKLEGLPDPLSTDDVRQAMRVDRDTMVQRHDLLVLASRARRHLTLSGYPLAQVDCREHPISDEAIAIHCAVKPGRRVRLEISGAADERKKRKKEKKAAKEFRIHVLDGWREVSHMEDLTVQAVRSAQSYYRSRGHARAAALAELVESSEGLRVLLEVDPGPVVRVNEVRLEGVESLNEEDVRSHLESDHLVGIRHPKLTELLLDGDQDVLRRLYYAGGFLDVQIPEPRQEYPGKPDQATVIFTVVEGPRSRLDGVTFEGNTVLDEEELRTWWVVPEDGYPDPVLLEHCASEIQRRYHHRGYADANVLWTLEKSDTGARAAYKIREGRKFLVRQVRVEGQQRVREQVIRREVHIEPGDLLRREELTETRERVRSLGMFQSVVVRGEPVPGEEAVRDVVVRVRERENLDLGIGVGLDDEEGARFSFSLGSQPLFGRAISSSLQFRVGGDLLVGQLFTRWRHIRGTPHDFIGSLGASQWEREGFTEEKEFLSLQLSRRLSRRSTILARYRVENIDLTDIEISEDEITEDDVFLASLGVGVLRNALDDPFLPRRGSLGAVDLSVFSEAVGSDENFARLFLGRNQFFPFRDGNIVFSISGRVGLAQEFGGTTEIPTSERFFAGGIESVRGYKQDHLGPLDPRSDDPVGGAAMVLLNQEARFRLVDRLSLHLFLDGGWVYPDLEDLNLGDLRFTAGPGLSYLTPAGPIRIYYGHKLDRKGDEDSGRLHFTFGRAF
jgi:outer membrane protein insertion porin family